MKNNKALDFYQIDSGYNLDLPYIGEGLRAGFPSPAEDHNLESINLTRELIHHPNTTFMARVVGDSMIDANIHEGDILIIDRSLDFQDNDVAVCFINGEFNIKYIERTNDELFLVSANPKYPKIKVEAEDNFILWGVVTYIIHKPNNKKRRL
ncbi:translesion error-prone DNA polymerase V autoproteolytic subunit [Porphyromonadaceae bacterium W3.11]|nr:translesion error-prone DNA polymerase V autoproteolytic subunit [Porphyromonadaceae bacterium W3.11]